ncbi:DNA-binding transcriptional regulator, LacI/PurR family [Arcanobacterium phocae]|uniref:DNA-binding transcriptional regulator, LacI/PurR family n=1 Tax=Arcanobacterium phocae TaxID=131112 RepID=A0A1H2LBV7_9ACTO|nr:LacI family DNA-binding transcriptional regulator [Arcanobacterium phocae]SDU78507.1 DNA-binding transcriptional regulator, LacI/PurR family [Arcanobacterium phocae]
MVSRIDQIAQQASVSKATVSRVLNNRPGVSPQMRRLVIDAIDNLGIERPQSLRARSFGVIGLVVPESEEPCDRLFVKVAQSTLAKSGYTPVLCTHSKDGISEEDYIGMLCEKGAAGIILAGGTHAKIGSDVTRYADLVAREVPIVFSDGFNPTLRAPFFSHDDHAASDIAVRHLKNLGHTRIGLLISSVSTVPIRRFIDGYKAAMERECGLYKPEWIVMSHNREETGYVAALRLLRCGVTAVVCGSDMLALGAMHSVTQHGKLVPGDISIIGYGDSNLLAYTAPPLTTVRKAMLSMGTAVAHTLIDSIEGEETIMGESLFSPELVIRETTAPPCSKIDT